RDHLDTSIATYDRIIEWKTASLFRWSTGCGARAGGAPPREEAALAEFGHSLGVAFQLTDDVLDYDGDPDKMEKLLFSDLREGKAPLPLLLAIVDAPALVEDLHLVREGDQPAMARVREAVLASGSCAEVRRRAERSIERARGCLGIIPPSPTRDLL